MSTARKDAHVSKRGRRKPQPSKTGQAIGARAALLAAAEVCLRELGYTNLSTRKVAEEAGMPLSQIHYHFGSKEALMLALLDEQNRRLLHRQEAMFAAAIPLWQRWNSACDYLDADLESGYVRVLQEMTAAGWGNTEIAAAVRACLSGWFNLLTAIAGEAAEVFGGLGTLEPDELASLVAMAFLGSEAMLLLGFEKEGVPIRRALRQIGPMIRRIEERAQPHKRPKR
jgi:AcrR family transcriptional regulator